jgi:hypothetical protein
VKGEREGGRKRRREKGRGKAEGKLADGNVNSETRKRIKMQHVVPTELTKKESCKKNYAPTIMPKIIKNIKVRYLVGSLSMNSKS